MPSATRLVSVCDATRAGPFYKTVTMPHQQTITIPSTNESLDLSWDRNWANFTIRQNGRVLCQMKDRKDLRVAGRAVTQAGKVLVPMLNQDDYLEIWCGGRELLSGAGNGDINYIAKACGAIKFCGYSSIVVGIFFILEGRMWVSVTFFSMAISCLFLAWRAAETGKRIYLQIAFYLCLIAAPFGRLLSRDIIEDINNGIGAAKD